MSGSVISVSPSFASHSSNNFEDTAARVVREYHNEIGDDEEDIFYFNFNDEGKQLRISDDNDKIRNGYKEDSDEDENKNEEEFEFVVVCRNSNSSPISADEISPRYPLFDRSLLSEADPDAKSAVDGSVKNESEPSPVKRISLRKLFSEERDSMSCSSSGIDDDLDGIAPGTYCVWRPKAESPGRCKKSNSTGNTSKRWRFRNLLHRSNSDRSFTAGKESSIVLFSPSNATKKERNNGKEKKIEKSAKIAAVVGDDVAAEAVAVDENYPASEKGGSRRRLYLPSVNGLSRNLHPF